MRAVVLRRIVIVSTVCMAVLCTAAPSICADGIWPLPTWSNAAPTDAGLDETLLKQSRNYALTGASSGNINRFLH